MWKWQLLVYLIRLTARKEHRFQRRMRALLQYVQEHTNETESNWLTHLCYPKQPILHRGLQRSQARIAIVMQGPLRLEDHFTLETVRHYRATIPESQVIISTWQGSCQASIRVLEELGAVVLQSADVKPIGHANINRQIVSTRVGLEYAAEQGFDYVLKTRTDARIYAARFADFLLGLVQSFDLKIDTPQRQRIAVLDLATRFYIPNHPSDILMFGHCEDLLRYWKSPLSTEAPRDPGEHGGLWSSHIPEVYLCENYLRTIGYPVERSLQGWWRVLADLFVVVDRSALEHFWPKHHYTLEQRVHPDAAARSLALCYFRDWVNLTQGVTPPVADDHRLQVMRIDDVLAAA